MRAIDSPAALYAHAIAIESEAAERYAELAERMSDLGNEATAEVFATLARLELEHLEALRRRTAGVELPGWKRTSTAGSTPARPRRRRASSCSAC